MNKTTLFIESTHKYTPRTTIVHARNTKIITDYLNVPVIWGADDIPKHQDIAYDNYVFVYASPYTPYKEIYEKIAKPNIDKRFFWLVNDHDLEDNIVLRYSTKNHDKHYNVICNNARSSYRHWILGKRINGGVLNDYLDKLHHINLNAIIYEDQDTSGYEKSGLIYFGTYRKHRQPYFEKYNYEGLTISTSTKNVKKYHGGGIDKPKFVGKLAWEKGKEALPNYKYSLYIEDVHTNTHFAHLANRYYECLMWDVLMLFDDSCMSTIEKSGYHIPEEFIVSSAEDLQQRIADLENDPEEYESLLNIQRSNKQLAYQHKFEAMDKIGEILQS